MGWKTLTKSDVLADELASKRSYLSLTSSLHHHSLLVISGVCSFV